MDAFREGLLALDPKGGQGRGQNRAAAELAHVFRSLKGGRASGGGGGGALLGGGLGGGRPQAAVRTLGLCRGLGINVQSQEDSQEFKVIDPQMYSLERRPPHTHTPASELSSYFCTPRQNSGLEG